MNDIFICESININQNQYQARFVVVDAIVKSEPGKMAVKKVMTIVLPPGESNNFEVGKSYIISISISTKK